MYYDTFECHGSPTLENYRNRLEVDERLLKNNMDNPVRRELLKKRIRRHKVAIAELTDETQIMETRYSTSWV